MKICFNKFDYLKPFETINLDSPDSVLHALKAQKEICDMRGFALTQTAQTWFQTDSEVTAAKIWDNGLTPYHNHDYFEINYCFDHTLAQYIDGKPLVMNPGDLLLMPPAVYHESCPVGGGYSMNLLLKESFINRMEGRLMECNSSNYLSYVCRHNVYLVFRNTQKLGIDKLILEFIDECGKDNNTDPYCFLRRQNLMEKLLLELTECERTDHIFAYSDSENESKEKAEVFVQYINEHYATVTLEEMSKKFGYSTQQIRRIIKKHFGYSYTTCVQFKRMGVAMNLLSKTDIPIKRIAEFVGLDSVEYFCRRFRAEKGMTPTEFRKLNSSQRTIEGNPLD